MTVALILMLLALAAFVMDAIGFSSRVNVMAVGLLSFAAVFVDIHNPELAIAALTVGASLLGAPMILRWDERRDRRG